MAGEGSEAPAQSTPWRIGSTIVLGLVGSTTRIIMNGLSTQKVHGLSRLLDLLDDRKDERRRNSGLITGEIV